MRKIIPSLRKMWLKVINLEQSLFPKLQESMGSLSPKEEKLIKMLRLRRDRKLCTSTSQITNPPKDREEMGACLCCKASYTTFKPHVIS